MHRNADHQAQREKRVHQRFAEFGFFGGIVMVEVEGCGVHRHGGEEDIVRFSHRATDRMVEDVPLFKFLEI